jgi:hypothetical protein
MHSGLDAELRAVERARNILVAAMARELGRVLWAEMAAFDVSHQLAPPDAGS